jgi:hypothetical protein
VILPVWNPDIENLAQELKSLIGYGAKPQHVLSRPVLRDLVSKHYPQLYSGALAQAIIHELKETAEGAPNRKAYWELYNLSQGSGSALYRRIEAIRLFGEGCNPETFRRAEGPEMERCREFAAAMWDRLSEQAA